MGVSAKKRPFLVELLGEERTRKLEETLETLEKELAEGGVAWKDATTFEEVDALANVRELLDAFFGIVQNVLTDEAMSLDEQREAIAAAAEELGSRLSETETKQLSAAEVYLEEAERIASAGGTKSTAVTGDPVSPYVEDLRKLHKRKTRHEGDKEHHDDPVGGFVADALAGYIIRN